jgi:hypothetical protein
MSIKNSLKDSVDRNIINNYLKSLASKNVKAEKNNTDLSERVKLLTDRSIKAEKNNADLSERLKLLTDKSIKAEKNNADLAEKLRLSENALAVLQQDFLILQEQLALIESSQPSYDENYISDNQQDECGYYFDWVLQGVPQRFRWMQPGSFLMGSPKSELERSSDEIKHRVTFQQGFWMADTACTQALWYAVMGDNPANFTDNPENPIEQVSWDNVQIFLQRANDFVPDMVVRLPSEAEWEYACRAGTSRAFSFGNSISLNQANYDGNYVYEGGGSKGEW